MPLFQVTEEKGFWDGAHLHKQGTKLRISKEKYERHLSLTFKPLDDEAKKDLEIFRKKASSAKVQRIKRDSDGNIVMKNGSPVWEEVVVQVEPPQWQQPESGSLNPNDRDDLRRLSAKASEGVEVVEAPPKAEVVEKIVSLE